MAQPGPSAPTDGNGEAASPRRAERPARAAAAGDGERGLAGPRRREAGIGAGRAARGAHGEARAARRGVRGGRRGEAAGEGPEKARKARQPADLGLLWSEGGSRACTRKEGGPREDAAFWGRGSAVLGEAPEEGDASTQCTASSSQWCCGALGLGSGALRGRLVREVGNTKAMTAVLTCVGGR